MVAGEKLNGFITYDHISTEKADGTKEWFRTGKISSYDNVNYFASFEATKESTVPRGYIIPARFSKLAEHLRQLGATVQQLDKAKTFSGEVFLVEKLEHSKRKFEGHFLATAEGKFVAAKRKFSKGDYVIDLAQPLANLIFYALEPESDDGLVTWNFLDEYFNQQNPGNKPVEYPVFKYFK
jgi:hypothetical protein